MKKDFTGSFTEEKLGKRSYKVSNRRKICR